MTGIYKIENTQNGKVYVGSSINIQKRWLKHQSELRLNRHPSHKLQAAYNLFGKDAFEYSVIEECPEDKLLERETYWILEYNSIKDGYNYLLGRKWDTDYLKTIDADNKVIKNPRRIRTDEEIYYIKAIQYVFGPCQTALAKIFGTTRSSINYYYNNIRYQEICESFNKLNYKDLSGWFDAALEYTDFSHSLISTFNLQTVTVCMLYYYRFNPDRHEFAYICGKSVSGADKLRTHETWTEVDKEIEKMPQELQDFKLFLFIKFLTFNRQSIAKSALEWAERFNDYLEREYGSSESETENIDDIV